MPKWAKNLKAIGIPPAPWSLDLKEGNDMDVPLMVELFADLYSLYFDHREFCINCYAL